MKDKNFSVSRFFLRLLAGRWWWLAGSLFFSFASVLSNMLTPQSLRLAIDTAISGIKPKLPIIGFILNDYLGGLGNHEILWASAALSLLFALLSGFFGFASRAMLSKCTEASIKAYRDRLFMHIQKLPYKWHSENQTGDIIQRATSDLATVRSFASMQAIEVVRTVFLLVAALWLMFSMNVTLSLAACAFIPFLIAYNLVFFRLVGAKFLAADEAEGDLTVIAQENLTGVKVVRAFGAESYEKGRFDSQNMIFTDLWVKLGSTMGFFWGLGDLVAGLQLFTIIILGSILAIKGQLTVGEFLVFVNYYYMIQWPVRALGRLLSEMSKARVSAKRLDEIERAEEEDEAPSGQTPDNMGEVVFSHVSFGYSGHPILKDISFSIPMGSSLGVLGPTGSGKSTLASLLLRLYDPDEGEIFLGGTDIKEIQLPYLRKKVGLVLQETFLFSRSIEENVAIACEGAAKAQIEEACENALLTETLDMFPSGYQTLVGERGIALSGGQKQRIAIARMLLRGADIFIFDDSLSAVDMVTDLEIRKNLKKAVIGKTSIIISHRASSLMDCDKILVLEDGGVSAIGSHRELMAKDGLYKKIFEKQSLVG